MPTERTPRSICIDYDLIVIGGGLQAYLLAEAAAKHHARVALVASPRLMEMAIYQTDRLSNWVEALSLLGVDVLLGGGHFVGRQSFLWQGKTLRSRTFVLAIPTQQAPLKIHGLSAVPFVTSEDFFKIEKIPSTIVIIGGDALSCSIAQSLRQVGTQVTLLVPGKLLLPDVDVEIARLLQARMEIDGIDVFTNTCPSAVDVLEDGTIKLWNSAQSLICQSLYLPLIMEDYLESLHLFAARVKTEAGMIIVNDRLQTTNQRIYLCHQVADISILIRHILFMPPIRKSFTLSPIVVNTEPEIATLGLAEMAAKRRYGKQVRVIRQPLLPLGLCKLLCLPSGQILGVHLMGERAKEVIESFALAMQMKLTLRVLAKQRFALSGVLTEMAEIFLEQEREQDTDRRLRLLRWFALRRDWNV